MRRAIVVRGKLLDGRIVELEEPVEGVETDVEVLVRLADEAVAEDSESPVMVVDRERIAPLLHPDRMKVEILAEQRRRTGLGSTTEIVMARRVESEEGFEDEEEPTLNELPKLED